MLKQEDYDWQLRKLREAWKGSTKKICILCNNFDNTGDYFKCKMNGYSCSANRERFENDLYGFNRDAYGKLDICGRDGKYFEHYEIAVDI
jgi:hypothetical protein